MSSLNEPSLRMQVVNLQTGSVSIEQVPVSKLVRSQKPVSELTDSQVEQATQLYPQVGYVLGKTLEQWIQGFTYDFHPDREIQVWSVIGAAFEIYNKTHQLTLTKKQQVVRRLIQLVGGEEFDDSLSLQLLKILNQSQEVATFVSRLKQPQQPWDRIDHQMLAEIYTEYVERHPEVIPENNDELFVTLARLLEGNEPASELGKELRNIWDELKKSDLENEPFDLDTISDERQKRSRNVVNRPGQKKFRSDLIKAYGGCCAITDCPLEAALHAAHIMPYLGAKTDHPSNGLLLRVDIHSLI